MNTPNVYAPGQHFLLDTGDCTYTFTIDKHFTPIKMSVVVLARCEALSSSPVIVKIFDHKYPPMERNAHRRPWTLEAERASTALAALDMSELKSTDWDSDDSDDAQRKASHAAMFEEYMRRLTLDHFTCEKGSYAHLAHLQGTALPRLLLTGAVVPAEERAIRPHGLVLEYIPDAVDLSEVAPDVLDSELCAALVDAVDGFVAHGVLHDEIVPNNILFAPKERPTRAVCIDFVFAAVRDQGGYADMDPETWREVVDVVEDGHWIRRYLKEKGVVVPEPSGTDSEEGPTSHLSESDNHRNSSFNRFKSCRL